MAKCQGNFISLSTRREVGFYSHLQSPLDEFLMLAEDKAAIRDGTETTCKLPGSPRSTFLMVFSPDGTKVASTHGDHKIYVTEIKSGKCLHTLEGHPRTPWCIAFHPTSNDILASGCLGGEVRIWDFHGGSELWVAEQNSVIASLAFHPFAQTLVIATRNELLFWDWSKSQPYARCKTASDREKVRYVKFDPLGHKLITGIANLPIVQSSFPDNTRTMANRYAVLRERYNRILEVRREWQRLQTPAAQNTVGTDPVATNERPTSPTQAEALRAAREYAQQETANANRSNPVAPPDHRSNFYGEYFEHDSWRYRDPYSLANSSSAAAAAASTTSASASLLPSTLPSPPSSVLSFQQEFINTFNSRLRESQSNINNVENSNSNQPSEMSLPSSLIQALVRIQRTLELLEPRMNSVADRRNAEQSQLRQRIEEVLNRLFHLYASITPLRLLMDEMFQDFDREIVLAEVSRDNANAGTSQAGIAAQLQELRQQLARLLERIFSTEIELQGTAQAHAMQMRRNVPTNTSTCVQSTRSTSTSALDSATRPIPEGRELPSTSNAGSNASSISTHSTSDSRALRRRFMNICDQNQAGPSDPRTQPAERKVKRTSCDLSSVLRMVSDDSSNPPSTSSLNEPSSSTRTSQWYDNVARYRNGGAGSSSSTSSSSVHSQADPSSSSAAVNDSANTNDNNNNNNDDNNGSLRASRNLSIPRLQIDPAEPLEDDNNRQPVVRPRSPPIGSILHNESPSQQQHFDYQHQAVTSSGRMRHGNRPASGSSYLHPNYFASLFEESLQRTSALQLVINRAIAGNSDFAVVNNVMSLTHRIQCWDFSNLQYPHISDAQVNVVVPECKIHNDASVDISSDGHLLATLVPGTISQASTTVVGIYSLDSKTFGACLYSYYFGPNAISVSLSPLSRYIIVGLASRRATVAPNEKQVVAQIFRLLTPKIDGQENLMLMRNIEQRGTSRVHVSLNSIRWLPHPGEGLVYGTNRGELRISRPGPSREDEYKCQREKRRRKGRTLNSTNDVQSASTQTVTPQTHSAGTQTGYDFIRES